MGGGWDDMGMVEVQPEDGRCGGQGLGAIFSLPSALVQGDLQALATMVDVAVPGYALIFLRAQLFTGPAARLANDTGPYTPHPPLSRINVAWPQGPTHTSEAMSALASELIE